MSDIALVYVPFGSREAAELAAVQMVDRRLAACANILAPCISVYHWEGRMARAEEHPVIFKTAAERRVTLVAALSALHDYAIPAISSWNAATTGDFGQWVEAETRL